jgi:hypothetical protein
MNPDLRKSHISNLSFDTSYVIPKEVRNKIERLSPPINQMSRFFDVYVHNRITHRCIVTIQFPKRDTDKSTINFEYQTRPSKKLPKKIPRIRDIIDDLCAVKGEHDFTCYSIVEYPKKEKRKFVVHLPLKISESSKMPINSISGLSVEGIVESQEYHSLLMVAPSGDHNLTLFFKKKYSFSESLPNDIISDMNKIVNTLVF